MGERGEGWVVGQMALLGLVTAAPPSAALAGARWLRPVGLALMALGGAIALAAAGHLGRSLTPLPRPREGGALVQRGLYAHVRHPLYLGVTLAALGWSLWRGSGPGLGLSVALFAFFDRKSRREERWLVARYPEYAAYQRRVRRLLPGLY